MMFVSSGTRNTKTQLFTRSLTIAFAVSVWGCGGEEGAEPFAVPLVNPDEARSASNRSRTAAGTNRGPDERPSESESETEDPGSGFEEPESTIDLPDRPLTYFQDIKPIVDARCTGCHTDGGIAPMALESGEDVQAWAGQINRQVVARTMPPWMASPDCNEYLHDRSLSDLQIATISEWAKTGAALGDPEDEGEPLERVEGDMSRVDLSVPMSEPYAPQISPDEYRCFVEDWPLEVEKYITGIGVTPGAASIVHHVIAYLIPPEQVEQQRRRDEADPGPGYGCNGTTTGAWLTSWEPGGHGIDLPHGAGIAVRPGSALMIQIHYNTLFSGAESDLTTVDLMLSDEVARPSRTLTWLNVAWVLGGMPIPAGSPDTMHVHQGQPTALLSGPIDIFWADIHMHALGSRGELSILRGARGTKECLLRAEDYRFEYQETFLLKEPVTLNPGDQLRVECHWDNTAENQVIINGERLQPRNVNWGDGTTDEMCLGNFLFSER